MLPHPIHRPRNLILFALAVLAALTALALVRAPQGHAVEYPYPYPEEPAPNPTPNPDQSLSEPVSDAHAGTDSAAADEHRKRHRPGREGGAEQGTRAQGPHQQPGPDPLQPQRREERQIHLHVSACLSVWKPLTVKAGVKPVGPVRLGTIVRPDGRTQVTYRGLPLYRFTGDTKPGDASGEGIHDVGVWHAAGGKR